ncbi:helix-turn-helix domain-containing protein [Gracilibacillus alcaliphilus]|uniref:helix-turn-helix domain-containing protein n=1 Tax=Gracilibacillus alcaliphilus TaxID=1401441 RepID=UPI00195A83C8|nr:helix-turn-helix transcriptional regulator [Gracilibacillus alcaliphilus]MBM7678930.1 transcriptional regulator with XRE-family HTH domain [Gracilibacillus alcaliphilus]
MQNQIVKKVDLDKIENLRKKANYSLGDMSKLLGYESVNGYYYLEKGRSNFSAETLAKVASIFDLTVDELFFEIEIAKTAN